MDHFKDEKYLTQAKVFVYYLISMCYFVMIILYILTEVHSGNTRRRAFFQNIFRLEPESDQAPLPPGNITWSCQEHNLDYYHHWHKDAKDGTESRMMKGLLLPRAELQRSERLEQGRVILVTIAIH